MEGGIGTSVEIGRLIDLYRANTHLPKLSGIALQCLLQIFRCRNKGVQGHWEMSLELGEVVTEKSSVSAPRSGSGTSGDGLVLQQ